MLRDKLFAPGRAYPVLAACIVAAALALRWQCLHTGFMVDDYLQLAIVEGFYPVERSPVQLYTFATGDRAQNEVLRREGLLAWWTNPDLQISMFRPLTCALFWLDHALFGHDAFAYHLHSAAWWIAMAAALAALLRRLLPAWVALLALALFVVDEAHIPLLNWITNRNASIAATFALVGLLAQVRHLQDGWRPGPKVALGAYALALASAEYALPFAGYALLCEWQQPLERRQRVRRLVWPALLLLGYFIVRTLFGAGTLGSGMYRHPLSAPLEFARDGALRFALLIADLAFALPSTYWTFGVAWPADWVASGAVPLALVLDMTLPRLWHGAAALVLTAVALWIGRAALRAAAAHGLPGARWLVLGAPLALLPVLSACAETRLAVPALVGCCVVPPLLLHARLSEMRAGGGLGVRIGAVAAALFVAFHLVAPLRARSDAELTRIGARAARNAILDPALDPLLGPRARVLLLGAADPTTSIYGALARKVHGRPAPAEWQLLSSTFMPQRLERLSPVSFVLERVHPGYTSGDAYAAFFTDRPMHEGAQFRAGHLQVTVERTHDGRPMRTRYEFDVPLEQAQLVFLTQTRTGLRRLALPAVGQSIIVEPPFPAIELR